MRPCTTYSPGAQTAVTIKGHFYGE